MSILINCNSSNNLEIENSTNNNLIRIIDLYGLREKGILKKPMDQVELVIIFIMLYPERL